MRKSCLGVIPMLVFGWMVGLVCAAASPAQTADELVTKYVQARGGLEKIHAVHTVRVTATMVMPKLEIPVTMMMMRPNSVRMEFQVQGSIGVRAFDGTTGWSQMPFLGNPQPVTITGAELADMRDQADLDGALVDYKAKGSTVELVGKEKVNGADAYKLKLTRSSGNVRMIYLDGSTYLDVKEEGHQSIEGKDREVETLISDYRDLDGLKYPFVIQSGLKDATDQQQKLTIEKVELNVPLDAALFKMPSATGTGK